MALETCPKCRHGWHDTRCTALHDVRGVCGCSLLSPAVEDVIREAITDAYGLAYRLAEARELPERWRNNDPPPPPGSRYSATAGGALRWCADSLEAALSRHSPAEGNE